MKLKFTLLLVLCVSIVLIYTACKKSSTTPSGTTLSPKQVSTQIALNLTSNLFGGEVDLSGGLDAPSVFTVHTKGKTLNDLNNPYCGLAIDTTLNATTTVGDTTLTAKGTLSITFNCANGVLSSFTTNDNLSIAFSAPAFSGTEKLAEDLTLASLDPSNPDANFSLSGSLSSSAALTYKTTASKNGTASYSYNITSLVIDPNNDSDIISGSATFTTQGSGAAGVWNLSGTIKFLGNHLATITINGIAYNVNLQTGVVS